MKKNRKGQVIIPAGLTIWNHELRTASTLASYGYIVEFLITKERRYAKSPDILMENQKWEIKSPIACKLSAIERNLKKAYHQSAYIVFDSRRMGRLPDASIQQELAKQYQLTKNIRCILFINRRDEVIDICALI